MTRSLSLLVLVTALPTVVAGADILPGVSKRFATTTKESPDFRRHVSPLLGRLGCNGRACHGSFQGRGGFRLSLFGYHFNADYEALTGGEKPRVNRDQPAESLLLRKPTLDIDHDGGELFSKTSWQHRLLLRWVESGAKGVGESTGQLVRVTVSPAEIVFKQPKQTSQLRVVAEWSDGTREDVSPLCRFRTNDDSVATVNADGLVTASGQGDTHVITFYDNDVVSTPVLMPVSNRVGSRYPNVETPTRIDELVAEKLRKLGLVPSNVCTDAEFLRRVSLDVTATPPTPAEIEAFLADDSPDKRRRKIDELLDRPTYAAWWTTRFCDFLGNSEENLPIGGEQSLRRDKSRLWYEWIFRRVEQNVPYDRLVEGLVVSFDRLPGQTNDEFFAQMTSYFRRDQPADFADHPTMPFFWSRGRFSPPQPLRFSYAFLGIRLECAECHKHPFDQWSKDDYDQFRIFFEGVRYGDRSRGRAGELKRQLGLTQDPDSGQYKSLFAKLAAEGTVVPWQELIAPDWSKSKGKTTGKKSISGRVITPKLLGGEELIAQQYNDPREPLMDWLRRPDNPYFARVLVNRVWSNYFGVGLVEPVDDMNLANPPSNERLLAYLSESFIEHGFDLKWLHREITNSRTYQLSWRPNATNGRDERNFSRAILRRLPAEVTHDALLHATASTATMTELHTDLAAIRGRAIGVSGGLTRFAGGYQLKLFGKPPRVVTCDCERSAEPSLLQTLYLRNDADVTLAIDRAGGWLREISEGKGKAVKIGLEADDVIRQAYLRTLCRLPTERETASVREFLAEDNSPAGVRSLLWTLVNTKEFILNH